MRLATGLLLLASALAVITPTPVQQVEEQDEFPTTPLQEVEEAVFTPTPALEKEESTGRWEAEVDTYWSGTPPLCLGGCVGKHTELRRDPCGGSTCCWVGYKSLCRVNCGKPDADFNAMVSGKSWWVGSVVRYSCRPGFLLIGNSSSTCQPNGKWTPKPTCLRICQQKRLEISERDIDGNCSSTCSMKIYNGLPKHGCVKIDNCQPKEPGWKRWFTACDNCVCDCYAPCISLG
ncbi:sushi, von Willebrand factor type A, EGF and pentraxin domain-containing protein 1 [Conger conger]|uniref:sushi, von Willebrand factor type A, EGF and pentraxin domain-containing protein 1 n=1 Tax=Conger conger TaxID=82655 RepID=UPI002A5A96C2|nr:sushi, von Willebrand factor type A, EGF and pentraxin domain-containing protein 1 [Conger conger]